MSIRATKTCKQVVLWSSVTSNVLLVENLQLYHIVQMRQNSYLHTYLAYTMKSQALVHVHVIDLFCSQTTTTEVFCLREWLERRQKTNCKDCWTSETCQKQCLVIVLCWLHCRSFASVGIYSEFGRFKW